jgi:hypothetical protein
MKRCSYCGKEYPDEASVCAVDGQPLQPVAPPLVAGVSAGQYPGARKLLTHIAPLRAGLVLAVLYAFFGLIFAPFFILMAVIGQKTGGGPAAFGGVIAAVFFPIIYAVGGFIGGLIAAAIYNLVAKWTGGLEFELRDAPPRAVY